MQAAATCYNAAGPDPHCALSERARCCLCRLSLLLRKFLRVFLAVHPRVNDVSNLMQYRHHFELKFQVLILKINGLLCIVQLLPWHAVNKGILIDWSTICEEI